MISGALTPCPSRRRLHSDPVKVGAPSINGVSVGAGTRPINPQLQSVLDAAPRKWTRRTVAEWSEILGFKSDRYTRHTLYRAICHGYIEKRGPGNAPHEWRGV